MCVRGAGPGLRPLGAPWGFLVPTPVGSPEATPASTRRLLTHGGLGAVWESGPSRGPTTTQPCLPLWPVRAGPGPRAVLAGGLVANWAERLELRALAKPALDRHFPPLFSAQPARVGARAQALVLLLEFPSPGRWELLLLAAPPRKAPLQGVSF